MGVYVEFRCDGCDEKEPGTRAIRQRFESVTGRPWGFGSYKTDSVLDVVPDRWVAFDLIGATYCPTCAADLFPEGGDGKVGVEIAREGGAS